MNQLSMHTLRQLDLTSFMSRVWTLLDVCHLGGTSGILVFVNQLKLIVMLILNNTMFRPKLNFCRFCM